MTRCYALVTGAQGFVGRYLVEKLLTGDRALDVVGIGRSAPSDTFTHDVTAGNRRIRAPLPPALRSAVASDRYHYEQVDLRDAAQLRDVFAKFAPVFVYHLASGLRDDAPAHLFSTSVEGTISLLDAAVSAPDIPQAIVVASSGSVYGIPAQLPIPETQACEPRDFYAICKLAQEHVSRIFMRERSAPVRIARIFNVIGPGQDERHAAGRFCAQVASIRSGGSERKIVVGDLTPTRDFIDVRDVASALIALADPAVSNETYNVASGVERSIKELLDSVLSVAELDGRIPIEQTYVRPSDTPRSYADVGLIRLRGFSPGVSFEQSVRDVLNYYRAATP